jgi:hypothetical protein
MFARASPSFIVTVAIGPVSVSSRCAYCTMPLPVLNVMNNVGS